MAINACCFTDWAVGFYNINYSPLTVFGGAYTGSEEMLPSVSCATYECWMNVQRRSRVCKGGGGGGARLLRSSAAEVSRGYARWVWQPQLLQINTPQKWAQRAPSSLGARLDFPSSITASFTPLLPPFTAPGEGCSHCCSMLTWVPLLIFLRQFR